MICDLAIWQAGSSRPYTSQANIYKHCIKIFLLALDDADLCMYVTSVWCIFIRLSSIFLC